MGGWKISTTHGIVVTVTIPSGATIAAKGYYVVGRGSQWLDNEDESIILRDSAGNEVDRTPVKSDTYNDERSWQRCPNGKDTDAAADWTFRTSTKGESNGKLSSVITCSISPQSVTVGSSVTISGSITPARSATVTIEIYRDTSLIETETKWASGGSYSYEWTPTEAGSYKILASWEGDEEYLGADSSYAYLTATAPEEEKRGCIVATSTYGSELSPEVQFLRGFRDSVVLSTFAGSQFIRVFNAWYYSFSPAVAGLIAGYSAVKTVMKGILYPLIGILHLSSMAYSTFSFSPELGVIMAGFVASSLIGAVYFTIPAAMLLMIIKRFKKKTLKTMQFKLLKIPWLISLALVLLGEIALSPAIMMAATASSVLTTLASSATVVASKITQRLP